MIILLFIFAFLLRAINILPNNTVIGYDQARDLWDATVIFRDLNIRIVGPVAGNNLYLHHGVAFLYYMIPPLVALKGNPIGVALWNSFFNSALVIITYTLARSMFPKRLVAVIASCIAAVSFQLIQFSGWLSNPSPAIVTVPIFFLGLWQYYKGKNWGLILASVFLGLSIQFELFFLYLIPVVVLYWLLLKPKFPSKKIMCLSILLLTLTLSTMIATEIKFGFAGLKSLLSAGTQVGGQMGLIDRSIKYLGRWEDFSLNIFPESPSIALPLGVLSLLFLAAKFVTNKAARPAYLFLLLFFIAPALMLLLGYHNAPWFLIGRPIASILLVSHLISSLRPKVLIIPIMIAIIVANISHTQSVANRGQVLLEPDLSSILSTQLKVIDYTYISSNKSPFVINSVTNPLYINATWSYNYYWYGKSHFGFLPYWLGGDQEYPYNALPKPDTTVEFIYLIIDETPRIPEVHKILARKWASEQGELVEEKNFDGISVVKIKTKQ